jgi:hypothetical protein
MTALTLIVIEQRPSNYVDPAERVAAANASKAVSDSIETWSVSEVDRKGKKKKGTLGVGNGAVFFASEADKVKETRIREMMFSSQVSIAGSGAKVADI